jgi:large subunit ribosomal protein L22
MGARKRLKAEETKEQRKSQFFAKLRNVPTSPRKMRLVADLIRGMDAARALEVLRYNPKEASGRLEKLLHSAMSNWQQKNQGERLEDAQLYVKTIFVDSGRVLKRLRPAPQGRAYRVRKRSNHVTIVLGSRANESEVQSSN